MTSIAATRQRWLFGPAPDLLLGCGVGSMLLILLLFVPMLKGAVDPWIVLVAGLLSLFTNTPHYGATLLRVYEHDADRRRFSLFTVHATALLAALFIAGIYSIFLGSLLITLYLTWAPWHFAGQNYGLGLMFLRRCDIAVTQGLKRLFYASFVLSTALTVLVLHRGPGTLSVARLPPLVGDYRLLSLGLSPAFTDVAFGVIGVIYLGVVVTLFVRLAGRASARELLPTASLIATQAVWFSLTALLHITGNFTFGNLALSAFGVSVAHSVQYLWVTSYYALRSEADERLAPYLSRTLLAGAAVLALPALLFAPQFLGTEAFTTGLGTVLFSVVNLHHFVLDGAIWKLRDTRVARVLLKPAPEPEPLAETGGNSRGWLRPLVWTLGALCVAIELVFVWEMEFGVQRALSSEEYERVQLAANRLEWIGRGDPSVHQLLADGLARQEYEFAVDRRLPPAQLHFFGARHHYQRSLELHPSAGAWLGLGNVHYTVGDFPQAHVAYDAALALEPRHARALTRKAELWLDEGDLMRARSSLQKAVALAPRDPRIEKVLTRLRGAEQKGDAER
ncbi:MAG: tetratricopeptide repeat protein [Myxococcota bacterium]